MADEFATYRTRGKSLDELMDDLDRGLPEGAGRDPNIVAIAFQHRVAKAQVRRAWISATIASVIVAIAAVLVAAIK